MGGCKVDVKMRTRDDLENVKLEMSLVILVRIKEAKLQDVRREILTVKMSTKDDLENVELGKRAVLQRFREKL